MLSGEKPVFKSLYPTIPGTSYSEVVAIARKIFHNIESKTRRTPYVRSKKQSYFRGQKIFLNMYFPHLRQKNTGDATRRLKFFSAGLDLLTRNTIAPELKPNPNKKGELLLRFHGETKDGKKFVVQVKKDAKGNHYLMSTFSQDK